MKKRLLQLTFIGAMTACGGGGEATTEDTNKDSIPVVVEEVILPTVPENQACDFETTVTKTHSEVYTYVDKIDWSVIKTSKAILVKGDEYSANRINIYISNEEIPDDLLQSFSKQDFTQKKGLLLISLENGMPGEVVNGIYKNDANVFTEDGKKMLDNSFRVSTTLFVGHSDPKSKKKEMGIQIDFSGTIGECEIICINDSLVCGRVNLKDSRNTEIISEFKAEIVK